MDTGWAEYVGQISGHQGEGLLELISRLRPIEEYQLAYRLWLFGAPAPATRTLLVRALRQLKSKKN